MNAKHVRQYITQDFSIKEKQSYIEYINGDKTSIDWIKKANIRRDQLLITELKCSECNSWINIKESGISQCANNHKCYDVVTQEIMKLMTKDSTDLQPDYTNIRQETAEIR